MFPYLNIFGYQITSYGLMMALGVLLAAFFAIIRGKSRNIALEDVLITGACTLGFGLIGAKLVYILVTYSLAELWSLILAGDFSFMGGGLVFYGGLIGGIFGAILGIKLSKCSLSGMERAAVPLIPLAHAVGRIGCLLAGCCHGMEYEGVFAVHYPNSVSGLSPEQGYFPVQPLESILNIVICVILLVLEKRLRRPFELLFSYLGLYAISRIGLEFLRGDTARGVFLGISSSQWIGLAMLAACAVFFVMRYREKKKTDVVS